MKFYMDPFSQVASGKGTDDCLKDQLVYWAFTKPSKAPSNGTLTTLSNSNNSDSR